ncbi:MAG: hypothetical protein V4641_13080 [Pseudomonadota bacterium]
MAKVSPIQHNFNAGEFSPLMFARSDVAKYKNALAICLNAFPLVQGGWTRRPGEYYVAPTKANGAARLVRFEFSTTQAYIIEFGNLYCRFYKNNGAITNATQAISGVTRANPGVLTYVGADPANGDDVEVAGVVGMTQLNGRRFTVANVNAGANTFELTDPDGVTAINTSGYTAYSSGGTIAPVYTLTTTYATADLFALKFTQSADTIYITHPSYPPRKMTRSAHNAWTITDVTFLDGPYLGTNTTTTTLTLSGTSGSITVTASASLFAASDVGRIFRWKDPANNWTWLTITAYSSATSVTATVSGPNASAGTATANWRLGVWGSALGYPGAACFNEDRLCLGGSTSYPQRIDCSNSGDYENMAPSSVAGTVTDSNAIAVTLNASDVNVIRWLQDDEKGLLIGTVGGEWILRPSSLSQAMSPTNVKASRSTTYGSANVAPLRAGRATLYLQRSGRKLRELAYVFQVDGFQSPDMTVLSEHITLGGLLQLAFQQETQAIVWGVRADGVLVGFTYEREQEVLGWHRHVFGGYSDSTHFTAAKVESVASIPAADGSRDESWVIVNRYINGKTRRYVGYLKKPWERGDAQADAFFVDSGLSLNNTVAQTLTPGAGATTDAATGITFTAGGSVFVAGDVNRRIHYDYTDVNGERQRAVARITGYTSATVVTATILSAWPNLTAIASAGWRLTVTTVTGLWHLEGESVAVFADGATLPAQTVANGSVTLTSPASKVAVGMGYNSDGKMLRIDAGAADGTAQGKIRRITSATFRFHDSLGIKIGPDFDSLVRKTFRSSSDPAGVAPPLFSGDKNYEWEGDYDRDGFICWRQDQPEPTTILAVMPQLTVQDQK